MAEERPGFRWTAAALPLTILASILVIYLPLPAVVLDWCLSANLAISLLILLTAVFVRSPLEFSIFPSILLVATMARIALNVATTRLILARGPLDGELAAGHVVRAFGEFVAADQLAVGLVIFVILFMVQFLVVTKGTTRIGEVAARFALDGLPGRQQAIDADLNAGVINHGEAQAQRRRLLDGADFYGSMDGASKYIRGEALAGAMITAINLVAGIGFGLSRGMSFQGAVGTFSVLTIGDGLASQLPALLTSLAAGLLVTRGSTSTSFSEQTWQQLMGRPAPLFLSAGLLVVFAMANMPVVPLALLALCAVGLGWWGLSAERAAAAALPAAGTPATTPDGTGGLGRMLESCPLLVELGSELLPLSVRGGNDDLLARISDLRGRVAGGLGIVVPKVRVRDNLALEPGECRILTDDQPVLQFRIPAGCCLLQQNAAPAVRIQGGDAVSLPRSGGQPPVEARFAGSIPAQLPWVGPAAWVRRELVAQADASSKLEPVEVVIRSLDWVIRSHAADLLDRDAVRQLLDEAARQHPVMVGEILAAPAGLQGLQQVLRGLVSEQVPLRPLHRLLELIQQGWSDGLGGQQLVAAIRRSLCRSITRPLEDEAGVIHCFGLSAELERWLADREPRGTARNDAVAASLLRSVETGIWHMRGAGWQPAMVVRQPLRQPLAQLVRRYLPLLRVIGDEELDGAGDLDVIARIRMGELPEPLAA